MKTLLVIPCYRESSRIGPFLAELWQGLLDEQNVEVLVVDDGSGELEAGRLEAIVEEARKEWPQLRPLLALPANQGKGGAVYAGWSEVDSETELLAFVDADGSCDAEAVQLLIKLARDQAQGDCAMLGSRVKMLGCHVERSWKRHLIGRVFATMVGELLQVPVYDSQCGLKVIPRKMFDKVKAGLVVKRFAFDVELLTALWDAECPMREVPIHWHEVPGGKVRLLRDSWRMFWDILAIRQRRGVAGSARIS